MRESQTPCFVVHSRWYGFIILVPRTNLLKIVIVWALRVVGGREFHNRVVDGKNKFIVDVRREKVGRNGC